jgi:hypothetical protein
MKKISLLLTGIFFQILLVVSNHSNAQGLTYGIKGGINYSSLNLDYTSLDKSRTGYHIGGFLNVPLSDRFSVQPEVLYSTKGAKVNYDFFDFLKGNVSLDLKYLDVPVLGVYRINPMFELQAGPYASVLLGSQVSNNTLIPFLNTSFDTGRGVFSKMDYGFIGGVGINLGNLGAGVRYNHGLGNVEKLKQISGLDYTISNARNSVWQVYLGYRF